MADQETMKSEDSQQEVSPDETSNENRTESSSEHEDIAERRAQFNAARISRREALRRIGITAGGVTAGSQLAPDTYAQAVLNRLKELGQEQAIAATIAQGFPGGGGVVPAQVIAAPLAALPASSSCGCGSSSGSGTSSGSAQSSGSGSGSSGSGSGSSGSGSSSGSNSSGSGSSSGSKSSGSGSSGSSSGSKSSGSGSGSGSSGSGSSGSGSSGSSAKSSGSSAKSSGSSSAKSSGNSSGSSSKSSNSSSSGSSKSSAKSSGSSGSSSTPPEIKVKDVKRNVYITDASTDVQVAVRERWKVEVTGVTVTSIQWSIPGSVCKSYTHDIDDENAFAFIPHANDNTAGDLQNELVAFFYKEDSAGAEKTATVKINNTWTKEVKYKVRRDDDPNMNIYCNGGGAAAAAFDFTPTFTVIDNHHRWHTGIAPGTEPDKKKRKRIPHEISPGGGAGPDTWAAFAFTTDTNTGDYFDPTAAEPGKTYNGKYFLCWHWAFLKAYLKWRTSFGWAEPTNFGDIFPPGMAVDPAFPAKPAYFTAMPPGGGPTSPIYGAAKLGDFANLKEMGADLNYYWHGPGHNYWGAKPAPDNLMTTLNSPAASRDIFWRWHNQIDKVRADFVAIKPETC
jgi:hypothetical protein